MSSPNLMQSMTFGPSLATDQLPLRADHLSSLHLSFLITEMLKGHDGNAVLKMCIFILLS